MNIILVRHGQSHGNLSKIWQGYRPSSLTEKGQKQAQRVAQYLKKEQIQYIYASDLQRATQTAQIIAQEFPNIPFDTNPLLREAYLGELEGQPHSVQPDWENNPPAGAETFDILCKRAKILLEYFYLKHKDDILLLVAHGGINKAIIQTCKGLDTYDETLEQKNCCVNRIEFNGFDDAKVLSVNEHEF